MRPSTRVDVPAGDAQRGAVLGLMANVWRFGLREIGSGYRGFRRSYLDSAAPPRLFLAGDAARDSCWVVQTAWGSSRKGALAIYAR